MSPQSIKKIVVSRTDYRRSNIECRLYCQDDISLQPPINVDILRKLTQIVESCGAHWGDIILKYGPIVI